MVMVGLLDLGELHVAKCNLGKVCVKPMLASGFTGRPCSVGSHKGFCRAYMFCLLAVHFVLSASRACSMLLPPPPFAGDSKYMW